MTHTDPSFADIDHDEGLSHPHAWAAERHSGEQGPIVADAFAIRTPSSAFHDDVHYC